VTHVLQFKTAEAAQDFSEAEVFTYEGYKLNRKLHGTEPPVVTTKVMVTNMPKEFIDSVKTRKLM